MVGVQTNQFPRALDMAKTFKAAGITVIMGGFHTSGTINMLGADEPDIQELFREGICVVSGEVEGKWEGILSDYLHGELKPLYSFAQDLQNLVDIEMAPLPRASSKTMEHFPVLPLPTPRGVVHFLAVFARSSMFKGARCASAALRALPP
jgi:hypothetical protein